MESLLAVADGDYTFDLDALVAAARTRWPTSLFARYEGPDAAAGYGQLQLLGDNGNDLLLVNMLAGGDGFRIERSVDTGAEFVAWLTQQPDFPGDGVVLTDWAQDFLALRRNTSAAELREAYNQ